MLPGLILGHSILAGILAYSFAILLGYEHPEKYAGITIISSIIKYGVLFVLLLLTLTFTTSSSISIEYSASFSLP